MQIINKENVNRVLACIKEWQLEKGSSPSYREIMRLCNLSSIGQVQRCVKALKNQGELESDADGRLALDFRYATNSKAVPLVGSVACGTPITAIENYETVYRLPQELIGSGEHFMLRAKGDSMTGVGIFDSDLLVIKKQEVAHGGQIVAALIEDDATVKTFYKESSGRIVLKAENPDYQDIIVESGDFRILGVLVSSFRKYPGGKF